jgi:energy-coupling factor transport system permease protein
MDARGFDSGAPRTAARRARFGRADAALIAVAVLLAVALPAVTIGLGVFQPAY